MTHIEKLHSNICQELETSFTKDLLQRLFLPVYKSILEKGEHTLQQAGLEKYIYKGPKDIANKSKREIIEAIACMFAGIEPYRQFRQALHKDALVIWDALVFDEVIGFQQAAVQYGLSVASSNKSGYFNYQRPDVKPPFEIIPRKSLNWTHFHQDRSYFFLPRGLRELLIQYYEVPDWAKLSPLEDLPEGAIQFSDTERQFFLDYARLKIYFKQGEIKYTAKNRPLASGIGKVQKTVKIREFFPDTEIKRHKFVRTTILAGVLPYLEVMAKKNPEPHNVLRDFFKSFYAVKFPSPPLLLPDIKGLGNIDDYYFIPFEKEMFDLLGKLPANSYVSALNILGYCKYNLINATAINRELACDKLSMDEMGDPELLYHVDLKEYKQAIQLPLIRGSFFLFAALGLCELVFEQVEPDDIEFAMFSAWDGLIAVKRTPLGDYVCGLTEQYQPSELKSAGFTLSDKALLIKLDAADTNLANSLSIFAEQTSPLSFKCDARSFLKNINRKEELTAKIELFKQMTFGNMPKNWEDFFKTLYEKIDPLKLHGDSVIFSVAKSNQELIRLLAQDPVIKTLISKAEGYLIIVPKKNYAALRRRLAEFGYLQT